MKRWKVALTVRVLAYIDAPDVFLDPEEIGEIGRDAVSVNTWSTGVSLELDNVVVDDVVEVGEVEADGEVIEMTPTYARLVKSEKGEDDE